VAQAQQYLAQGYGWVIDLDLEKFFDRVNHDKLMGQITKRVEDKRLLKLIRAFLNAGVMENGLVSPSVEGTPQGGPLSPLLSNLVLDDLDQELERRGHRFVRYADDCNIYVRSERAGQRVMESITRFITQKLKLKVNQAKSAVARPQERKFLGFSFTAGPDIKRTIAPKSLERFKQRIRDITRRAKGVSITATMEELAPYMRGWRNYFGFCETPEVLVALTRWVRLRLRAALWRQWKTPRRRRAALIANGESRHGLPGTRPAAAAVLGISPAVEPSLPGSPMRTSNRSVCPPCSKRVSATSRTAVYGPVRTVVWEGRGRETPPYPDQ
jgi:RNA-directed DNA polymerase